MSSLLGALAGAATEGAKSIDAEQEHSRELARQKAAEVMRRETNRLDAQMRHENAMDRAEFEQGRADDREARRHTNRMGELREQSRLNPTVGTDDEGYGNVYNPETGEMEPMMQTSPAEYKKEDLDPWVPEGLVGKLTSPKKERYRPAQKSTEKDPWVKVSIPDPSGAVDDFGVPVTVDAMYNKATGETKYPGGQQASQPAPKAEGDPILAALQANRAAKQSKAAEETEAMVPKGGETAQPGGLVSQAKGSDSDLKTLEAVEKMLASPNTKLTPALARAQLNRLRSVGDVGNANYRLQKLRQKLQKAASE